uniref:Uncharacterized protein n=1 Tax=Graphocephala atropunctata TaxID=36148 RepID=A0A1B6KA68_9HEMI
MMSQPVMLAETMLEEVYCSKFLGIYLNRGLTWNDHIDHVCSKLASGIYVLRSLAKYCPSQVLMVAYYGLIYPHLTYGLVLWGSWANNQFIRVFKLQKQAIHIIAQLRFRVVQGSLQITATVDASLSLHLGNNFVLYVKMCHDKWPRHS